MFVDSHCTTTHFQPDLIPPALDFYRAALGALGRPNHAGWCACRCPFHESKSGKSFAVHVDGAFICRGCGVRGGDVISFLRLGDGLSFKEACQQLGCWDEAGKPTKASPGQLVPYLVMDYVIDGVGYRASVKDEPLNYADKIRRFYREAGDRLIELGRGDREAYVGEQETCWARMACAVGELRD